MAARASGTTTSGTPRPSGRSHTSAAAPRSTASGAKSWPSVLKPGTQKKSAPGATLLLLYARLEISTSGAPLTFPIRSRRVTGRGGGYRLAQASKAGQGRPAGLGSVRRNLEVRKGEGDDLLERGRRHRAAVDVALRLVDHDGHEQARVARGRVADERRDEPELGVAAHPVGLLGGAGLARERVAGHLRLLRRAARPEHALEHARDLVRGPRGDDPVRRHGIVLDHVRPVHDPAVGDRLVRGG